MANDLVVIKETSDNRDIFRMLSNVLILAFVVMNIYFIAEASTTFFSSMPTALQN
jgi:hypothetical protein